MSTPRASERGRIMLADYAMRFEYATPQKLHPEDLGSFLGDLTADLLHYAASAGIGESFIDMARVHFEAEREGGMEAEG